MMMVISPPVLCSFLVTSDFVVCASGVELSCVLSSSFF